MAVTTIYHNIVTIEQYTYLKLYNVAEFPTYWTYMYVYLVCCVLVVLCARTRAEVVGMARCWSQVAQDDWRRRLRRRMYALHVTHCFNHSWFQSLPLPDNIFIIKFPSGHILTCLKLGIVFVGQLATEFIKQYMRYTLVDIWSLQYSNSLY